MKAAVCSQPKAREFLESISVQEPDRVDELIRSVLPKYRERHDIPSREYADDLRQIVGAYGAASVELRRRLAEALRETPFVRVVDAGTGELSFALPGDVYARQLHNLFEGVNDVLIARLPHGVPAAEARPLFAACGVSRTLAPVDKTPKIITRWSNPTRFSYEELAVLRRKEQGNEGITWQRDSSFNDSMLRGLDELINRLPELPSDAAESRARLLWDTLCATAQRSEAAFSAQYRWYRNKERWADVDSASVDLLNRSAWVPASDGTGRLLRPSQVSLDDLGWRRNTFLESKIEFRPPAIDVLAKEAGVDLQDVELAREIRESGRSLAEIRAFLKPPPSPPATEEAHPEDDAASHTPSSVPTPHPPLAPIIPPAPVPLIEGAAARGESRERRVGTGGGGTFGSYIRIREEAEGEPDPDRLSHEQRMALEAAAIDLILRWYPNLLPTRPNNPGFDLYETDDAGVPVRWIEVKAMSGSWESRPVALSPTQFEWAREKGDAYWLYVVEYAGTDSARIMCVQSPADGAAEPPRSEASPA